MRRIVANFFISLDGVVEAPHEWHFPYFDDAMGEVVFGGMQTQDAFLMGRTMYDQWSVHWTTVGKDDEFGRHINAIPKYVVTHRPVEGDLWTNTTVIGLTDAAAEVRALKESGDGEIAMSGSTATVRWLLAEGLLDELNLLVHPIAVGHGDRLFDGTGTVPLRLLENRALPTGVLHSRYAPTYEQPAPPAPGTS